LSEKIHPIRLVVFDVDGVLTRAEGKGLDLELLERLANMNRAARHDASQPAVSLCTGRPASYLEALLQAIHGRLPAVFENGAGLYLPDAYQFLPHPELETQTDFAAVRQRLEETLIRSGQAYFQPGKQYSLSLIATIPAETNSLYGRALAALGSLSKAVDLVYSVSCLNVLPVGIHKGKGIDIMARRSGYKPGEILGVGDSDVDLTFLASVGHTAAPANANPAVKRVAQYISPRPAADGVRDILDHFGL
jgi:hydroxymethylpyrimidine pyrophosphatase-like HAD family hydrolase